MSNNNITRAWKDAAYRSSLSDAQRAALPANPAGSIELTSEELTSVSGATPSTDTTSIPCQIVGPVTKNADTACNPTKFEIQCENSRRNGFKARTLG